MIRSSEVIAASQWRPFAAAVLSQQAFLQPAGPHDTFNRHILSVSIKDHGSHRRNQPMAVIECQNECAWPKHPSRMGK